MDIKDLAGKDAEADNHIKSWSESPFFKDCSPDFRKCTQDRVSHLNEIYETSIDPGILIDLGNRVYRYVIENPGDVAKTIFYSYLLLKAILHDNAASGKEPPTPEEFGKKILQLSGTVNVTITPTGSLTLIFGDSEGNIIGSG